MTKAGKINISDMKKFINKKVGLDVAHDLREDNPTEVKEWIPTGSRWLDSIICRGKMGGIPVGTIPNSQVLVALASLLWPARLLLRLKRRVTL